MKLLHRIQWASKTEWRVHSIRFDQAELGTLANPIALLDRLASLYPD